MIADPPMTGVRTLSVGQHGARPSVTLHLADMGAEIIQSEDPVQGDTSRAMGPHYPGDGN